VQALDRSGLAESTLVLFTADHGLAMPRAKCTLYDTGIGVALIVRWPAGGIGAGISHGSLVSNVDVVPTLLEATRTPITTNLHGTSLLPLLREERSSVRDTIFAEKTFHSYYDPMRAIRTDRYKFIRSFDSGFAVDVPGDVQLGAIYRTELQRYVSSTHPDLELYDLVSDPLETHNLIGQADYATIQSDLDQRLWQWMTETDDPLLNGPIPSPAYRRAMAARPSP
jgi:arylsulfatase A-like enzyme